MLERLHASRSFRLVLQFRPSNNSLPEKSTCVHSISGLMPSTSRGAQAMEEGGRQGIYNPGFLPASLPQADCVPQVKATVPPTDAFSSQRFFQPLVMAPLLLPSGLCMAGVCVVPSPRLVHELGRCPYPTPPHLQIPNSSFVNKLSMNYLECPFCFLSEPHMIHIYHLIPLFG